MITRWRHPRGEDGAVAIFAVVVVMALFLAIGLVVDGGSRIRAMQRADALAAEAARTGAQSVIFDGGSDGSGGPGGPSIDFGPACRAAATYLVQAGAEPGDCGRVDDTTLRVGATISYDHIFLSLIGPATSQVTGSAQARLARGVGDEQ